MSITETDFLRLSRRVKVIEDLPQSAGEISLSEVGAITLWPCGQPPESWLTCDGAEISRTQYAALFSKLCVSKGCASISIHSPAVISLPGHGFADGDKIFLKTSGVLPSGLSVSTQYYIKWISADTFSLSLSSGGAAINTSGSQYGIHTVFTCPWGVGSADTFTLPNLKGRVPVGRNTADTLFDRIAENGGEKIHTLAAGEIPAHSHKVNPPLTDTGVESVKHTHTSNPGSTSTEQAMTAHHGQYASYYFPSSGTSHSVCTTVISEYHSHSFDTPSDVTTEDSADHRHSVDIAEFDSGSAGSGTAHNNLQPYVVMDFIIRYQSYVLPRKGDKGDKGETGDRGDAAPNIVIAYSANAESWHSGYSGNDDYIRFSTDGAKTWGGAVYIRGRVGERGIQGVKGDTGISCRMRGEYDGSTLYVNNQLYIDCVTYNGSSYYAKQDTTGNLPADTEYWGIMARKGTDGAGTGDVVGPHLNTDDKFPQWDGADSKKLKDGCSLSDLMLAMHPVGAVYISVSPTSPAALFGGTWQSLGAGRTLVGIDGSDADFDTAGETGGEKAHTLIAAEMPLHTHTQNPHTHTNGSLAAVSGGAHTHELQWTDNGYYVSLSTGGTGTTETGYITGYSGATIHRGAMAAASAGGHGHSMTGAIAIATAANQNTGSGSAHNNMPPYIVVFMWKRTA